MPRKSVAEIEEEIDKALRKCRSPFAEGLWRRMRYHSETESDRKPHARINGLPVLRAEQLSIVTGCSSRWVARGLPKLLNVGLIEENAEGYYPPHLRKIMEVRTGDRERQERRRLKLKRVNRKGVTSRPKGVTSTECHTNVTPESPPKVSPPITPSSNTPSFPIPTESGGDAPHPAGEVKKRGSGVGVTLQARVMEEVWKPKWAAAHFGEDYSPGRADYVMLARILDRLGAKKDEARAVVRFAKIADTALAQEEHFGWQGHRLALVEKHLQFLISETAKTAKGLNHAGRKSHERINGKTIEEPNLTLP